MSKNKDNTFNVSKDDLILNKNYLYCIEFVSNLSIKYYNICIKINEESLFKNNQHNKAFDLCNYLLENNSSHLALCEFDFKGYFIYYLTRYLYFYMLMK